MSSTYTHTKRKAGFSMHILRFLAVLYFILLGASVVYLWLFTNDRFISTAEFKISKQNISGSDISIAQLALPGLGDTGSVDSQISIGYINSADLLIQLEKEFDLVKHYSSPVKDIVFRLEPDSNLEERLKYYRKRILAHFDKETGMTVISVDTFDAGLSQKVASFLLSRTESFINKINQDIADQQMAFVRAEVDRSAKKVENLNAELITLQNQNNFITPDEVISASLKSVEKMRLENLKNHAELSSILRDSPSSPRIENLRSRIRSLDELIAMEAAKLSGPEQDRLNQLLVRYKMLEHQMEFALRLRTGAETMLEKNRVDAISRSLFFTVIQSPFLPEDVGLPRRPYATVTLIVLGGLLFVIFRAITTSVFSRL